ncbi:MAG: hypothetical protein EBV82_06495 [Chitinophagia bacterium]|jgi:hypothetical protein|nr:hypothetical protein [Chitinophagia bacterium]
MATGLLHLHNLLRWVILITLFLSIYKLWSKQNALGVSKILLISAHTTLILGLYQYITGAVGLQLIKAAGMGAAMKDAATRFWAVEHIFSMVLAISLITIGHVKYKKSNQSGATMVLYIIALLIILSAIPWPFRAGIGRPWFPGVG